MPSDGVNNGRSTLPGYMKTSYLESVRLFGLSPSDFFPEVKLAGEGRADGVGERQPGSDGVDPGSS